MGSPAVLALGSALVWACLTLTDLSPDGDSFLRACAWLVGASWLYEMGRLLLAWTLLANQVTAGGMDVAAFEHWVNTLPETRWGQVQARLDGLWLHAGPLVFTIGLRGKASCP